MTIAVLCKYHGSLYHVCAWGWCLVSGVGCMSGCGVWCGAYLKIYLSRYRRVMSQRSIVLVQVNNLFVTYSPLCDATLAVGGNSMVFVFFSCPLMCAADT